MTKDELFTLNVLSSLVGGKKFEILTYLMHHLDEDLCFHGTYEDILKATNASKPTLASLFKDLKNIHLLKKEKNGLYRFSRKISKDLVKSSN